MAHRTEPLVAVLTLIGAVTTLGVVHAAAAQTPVWGPGLTGLLDAGSWSVGFTGLLIFGLAARTRGHNARRPLGMLWDLICFLPRAAHPLGPPCYGERVIPELLGRYRWWLSGRPHPDRQPRQLVVSAHSHGAVLAVASLLGITDVQQDRGQRGGIPVERISLLTYGVQLRALFSRFFPELIEARALGITPCPAPRLFARNAWTDDHDAGTTVPEPAVDPCSVRGLLADAGSGRGRWVNLWRLTDFVGFPLEPHPDPVAPSSDRGLDRFAEEVDMTGYLFEVVTHLGYPRSRQYGRALRELVDLPGK